MSRDDWRLPSETFTLELPATNSLGEIVMHEFAVTFSYWPERDETGRVVYHTEDVHDIIFVGRGKIGQGLDLMFTDLGLYLSRIKQGRDPI